MLLPLRKKTIKGLLESSYHHHFLEQRLITVRRLILRLIDQTQILLHEYCLMKHGTRFGKLLLSISSITCFSKRALEELFFNKNNGIASIHNFILEVLH